MNVMAVCDFNLIFRVVLAGWEGTATDARVSKEARDAGNLVIPPGKFLLADAGYAFTEGLLRPYLSTRYHLQEWCKSTNK